MVLPKHAVEGISNISARLMGLEARLPPVFVHGLTDPTMTFPATFKLGNLAGKAEADSVNLEPKPQSRAAKASAIQAIQANLRAEAKAKNDKKAK